MMTILGKKSFVVSLGLAMLLSAFVVGAANVNDDSVNSIVAELEWEKQGVVIDSGAFGIGVQYPFVLYHEGIYKMWYSGIYGALDGEIFYATSADGVDWTEHGCVLAKLPGTEYVVAPSVIIEDDGTYKMWFSCHDGPWQTRTYLATSSDGLSWTNQGLAFDLGPPGSPDSQYAVHAKVFKDDGLYKMYYKAYDDNSIASFMYSTSTDGYSWTKHGVVMETPMDFTNIQCPFVVKNAPNNYTMWYQGNQGVIQIYIAYSTDGINWVQGGIDLDVGVPGELDDAFVACPFILSDPITGDEMMYYAGSDGTNTRIFLATIETETTSPIIVTSPNGGEIYEGSSIQTIEWDSNFDNSTAMPVGHWKLDETSGLIAYDSIGTNHGALVNLAESQWTAGIIDGGLYYPDTASNVNIPDDGDTLDFGLNEDFSVYCWLKTSKRGGYIIDKRFNEFIGYTLFVRGANEGYLAAKMGDGSYIQVVSSAFVADNVWHHLGMVKEGDVLQLYVDGEMVKSGTGANKDYRNTAPLKFGKTFIESYTFEGTLDDVRIYDQAVYPEYVYAPEIEIDLYYSVNNGNDWTLISSGEENDGTYDWATPEVDSDQCLIKAIATDSASQTYEDVSDETFTIYIDNEEVDLSIYDQDITFSNPTPQAGDTVNIQATVHGDPNTYDNATIITPIFEDDFDDGTISKWRPSHWNPSGVSQVTDAQCYSSPYSWYAQSYSWENTGPWLGKFFDEGYQGIRAETQFYLPTKSQSYERFQILRLTTLEEGFVDTGGDIATENNLLIELLDDDYSIDIVDIYENEFGVKEAHVIGSDIYELTPNAWHNVSIDVIDYDIAVTVDGIVIFNGQRHENASIDMLILGDTGGLSGGYGEAYWDDVKVYSIEDEVTTIPGLDATCTVSFYLDETIPENLIYQETGVFVPGDGETVVSFDWTPDITGNHDILVEISETNPSDYNLSNNLAESFIDIQEPIISFATATGPQGAHHEPNITITYEWTGNPEAICLYYSSNGGDEWIYLGTDFTVDGFFSWTPEDNPGPKPSKYYWIANALNGLDDVGTPPNNTPPEAGPFNWKTFDVKLGSGERGLGDIGWHFISVPLEVSGEMSAIFDDSKWGDSGTTWDCIKWYDPTDNKDPWKTYRVGASTNDLFDYSNGMGVWIHITSNNGDGVLTAGEGIEVVSTTISLSAGWNMVGYPTYCDTKDVGDAFWGTGADRIEIFDPAEPYLINEVGPSHIMMPGAGYWVHVPVDTVWVVDW